MSRWDGSGRWVAMGVAAALMLLVTGDGRAADPRVQGIDPLEVLNLRVKPNVVFLIDNTSSMARPADDDTKIVGPDDPNSRFYHLKLALRDTLAANGDDANIGFAMLGPLDEDKTFEDVDGGGGPFVYVSQDAAAADLLGRFTALAQGSGQVGQTNNPNAVWSSLNNTQTGFDTAYPTGCVAGTTCRYYLKSRVFRHDVAFTVNTGAGTVTSDSSYDCPPAPAGLLGDDTADTNPAETRACMLLRDETTGATATYYFTSAVVSGLDDASVATACDVIRPDSADGVAVPACTVANTTALNNTLRLSFGINDADDAKRVQGLPERFQNEDVAHKYNLTVDDDVISGIRLSPFDATPATNALKQVFDYYTGVVFPARPAALTDCAGNSRCLQRNYVIYVTDGLENSANGCEEDQNSAEAIAQAMYQNGGASTNDDLENRIETIVVAYTGFANNVDQANDIARAGTGGVPDTLNPGRYTCSGGADSCADAIRAGNAAELSDALTRALNTALVTGSYSDQQSITETVYELSQFAPRSSTTDFPHPDDPDQRYKFTLPLVFQSTFDMPGFVGHLKSFRRESFDSDTIVAAWGGTAVDDPSTPMDESIQFNDAGGKLTFRVQAGMYNTCAATASSNRGECTYAQLVGSTFATAPTESSLTGAIKRRIFTSRQNGVFTYGTTVAVTTTGTNATSPTQVPLMLWPNQGLNSTTDISIVDAGLGIGALTFDEMKTSYSACANATSGDCTSGVVATKTAAARQETRQIILAYMAGAQIARNDDATVKRNASGAMLFRARDWVLPESTLAAPGVVTPPLDTVPTIHTFEYSLYTDGSRNTSDITDASLIPQGYGLRNPDLDATGENKSGTDSRTSHKPMMSVVYHAANDGLHAFRAGPACGATVVDTCQPTGKSYFESGGEELWMFVPYDQMSKLPLRLDLQNRDNHVYMLSAPVRFGDVFVKATATMPTLTNSSNQTSEPEGKWRTIMYLGRGIGGKHLSALDVTFSGTYNTASLDTPLPGMVFNRGNPDTVDGTAAGVQINTSADRDAYATMGQTWSVPILGRPRADLGSAESNRTGRCPSDESPCVPEFALWMGSGFGDNDTQGSTFYMLDAQTGDVLRTHDVGDKAVLTASGVVNSIVASPAGYNVDQLVLSDEPKHPASGVISRIYVGDVHGRLWKFLTDSTVPEMFADAGDDQPISVGAGLIAFDSDGSGDDKPHVYVETGYDCRLPGPNGSCSNVNNSPPFKMLGFRDDDSASDPSATDGIGGLGTYLFGRALPPLPLPGYRGTTQPATVFAEVNNALLARVFFAGNSFLPAGDDCIGRFESIVFILGGKTGLPAYNLPDENGAAFKLSDQRVMGLRTVGGQLVVDRGIDADSAPPPPAPPVKDPDTATGTSNVFQNRIRYGTTVCH